MTELLTYCVPAFAVGAFACFATLRLRGENREAVANAALTVAAARMLHAACSPVSDEQYALAVREFLDDQQEANGHAVV